MATDIVAQLADSLAKTGVEEGELSYKGQGRKLDDAQSGECKLSLFGLSVPATLLISDLLYSPIPLSQPVTTYSVPPLQWRR